ALAYAHKRGFVHRDIKPANILLSEGHALVADFGIARAMEGGGEALTQTGLAIGTPHYMSPEQATGAVDIDGRTDIYALGCVLYEMLTGEPPFTGPSAQTVLARSLTEAPRPVDQTRVGLAPQIGAAVMRALAKTPADRYATGTEMVEALVAAEEAARPSSGAVPAATAPRSAPRWRIAVAALLVLGAAGVAGKAFLGKGAAAVTAPKRIAVLPFENLGAAEDAYLADGIVDELRGKLATIGQLTVIASTSADQYRQSTKTDPEIASELRVDQLLRGKVQWAPGGTSGSRKVRVSAELIDGQSGAITWRDTFDADMTDVFSMQSALATRVAGALGTAMQGRDSAAVKPATNNPAAWDLFLKARAITNNSASAVRQAVNLLEQAVALDSTFAPAWALLGSNLSTLYSNGTRDLDIGRRAKVAVDRARALAEGESDTHRALADYYGNVSIDLDARDRELTRALELKPNDARLLARSADIDFRAERYDEVFKKLSRARELDPRSSGVLVNLIRSLVYLNRFDEAKKVAVEMMALQPTTPGAIEWAAGAYLVTGDLAGARAVIKDALARIPATDLVTYFAGYNEMAFSLDKSERDLLFRLTPAAFDNDRAWWGQALSIAAREQGDLARSKAYADSSLLLSRQQSEANPKDIQLRALYAVMLAYDGQTAEAITQVEQAVADSRKGDNNSYSYARLQRVRVYLAAGDKEKAMDSIAELLQLPYHIKPGWMRVDPIFAPLKGNARFEKLLAGGMQVPSN
ncbi:MAG: protein kinase, partial [Gemmatimonadales bacterium]|nr:protein kinase [Gemmatimonadales bacterium]